MGVPRLGPRARFALRLGLGAALLALLVRAAHVHGIRTALASADVGLVALALVLDLANGVIGSLRWRVLLADQGHPVPFGELLRAYYRSFAIGTFLPTGVGTDALRVIHLGRYVGSAAAAVSILVVDRAVGLAAIALVALGALAALPFVPGLELPIGAVALLVAVVGGAFVLPWLATRARVAGLVRRGRDRWQHGLTDRLVGLYDAVLRYRGRGRALLQVLGLAVLTDLRAVLLYYVLARALGAEVSLVGLLVLLPILAVVEMLPISIGGIGVTETAVTLWLQRIGVPLQVALGVALLTRGIQLVDTLPGTALHLFDPGGAPGPAAAAVPTPERGG